MNLHINYLSKLRNFSNVNKYDLYSTLQYLLCTRLVEISYISTIPLVVHYPKIATFLVIENNRIPQYKKWSKIGMRILFTVLQNSVREVAIHFKSDGFQCTLYEF